MGVTTKADRLRDNAKEDVSNAIEHLLQCMDEQSFEEYKDEYQHDVEEACYRLIKIKKNL